MYLEHFGLTEPPFTITPHTEFFFAGANRGATLEGLLWAVTHGEGIVKMSGEVGSGKTMLCRVLMERLPREVETVYLAVPSLDRDEILAAVAHDLGVASEDNSPLSLSRALQQRLIALHGEGRRAVALIDEAHAMPLDSLEEIRLLSNLETNRAKLLQIVLFGQPELDEHLAQPRMRPLRERITHSFRLSPLTTAEIGEYLSFRLRAAGYRGADVFCPVCIKAIARASEGLTRRVNIIADKSLLAAFAAATRSVTVQHVRAAICDCDFAAGWSAPDPRSRTRPVAWPVVSALAAGLALGAGAVWLAAAKPPAPAAAAPSVAAQEPTSNGVAAPALPPVAASQPAPGSLAAVAGNSLPAVVASPAATPQPTAPEAAAARTNAESQPLAERLRASQDWLATRAAQNFAIQLMVAGASQPDLVARHIRAGEAVLGTSLHAYPMALSGGSMVGVVYGDFADRSAAQAALARLPPELAAAKPYVRTFQAIRGDAR